MVFIALQYETIAKERQNRPFKLTDSCIEGCARDDLSIVKKFQLDARRILPCFVFCCAAHVLFIDVLCKFTSHYF